jgi:hypothetical protein
MLYPVLACCLCDLRCDIGVCTKVTCAFMALTLIVQMVARGRAVAQHVARRYAVPGGAVLTELV